MVDMDPCGSYCSKHDAETLAILNTLDIDTFIKQFQRGTSTPTAAIQEIENSQGYAAKDIGEIILTCDRIMSLHSDMAMNDKTWASTDGFSYVKRKH